MHMCAHCLLPLALIHFAAKPTSSQCASDAHVCNVTCDSSANCGDTHCPTGDSCEYCQVDCLGDNACTTSTSTIIYGEKCSQVVVNCRGELNDNTCNGLQILVDKSDTLDFNCVGGRCTETSVNCPDLSNTNYTVPSCNILCDGNAECDLDLFLSSSTWDSAVSVQTMNNPYVTIGVHCNQDFSNGYVYDDYCLISSDVNSCTTGTGTQCQPTPLPTSAPTSDLTSETPETTISSNNELPLPSDRITASPNINETSARGQTSTQKVQDTVVIESEDESDDESKRSKKEENITLIVLCATGGILLIVILYVWYRKSALQKQIRIKETPTTKLGIVAQTAESQQIEPVTPVQVVADATSATSSRLEMVNQPTDNDDENDSSDDMYKAGARGTLTFESSRTGESGVRANSGSVSAAQDVLEGENAVEDLVVEKIQVNDEGDRIEKPDIRVSHADDIFASAPEGTSTRKSTKWPTTSRNRRSKGKTTKG